MYKKHTKALLLDPDSNRFRFFLLSERILRAPYKTDSKSNRMETPEEVSQSRTNSSLKYVTVEGLT